MQILDAETIEKSEYRNGIYITTLFRIIACT